MQGSNCSKLGVIVICAIVLLGGSVQIREIKADSETQMIIHPGLINVEPGDNFTITINATNVVSLSTWQLALKFNLTLMNITTMWVPAGVSIFGNLASVGVDYIFGVDILDHMGYVAYGNSLILDTVTSANGILCKVNCTAIEEGTTTILIATKGDRAHITPSNYDAFYSFLLDADGNEMQYAETSATLISGGGTSKPVAKFTVITPVPDNSSRLVLSNHPPVGDALYYQTYVDMPVAFDGSASFGVTILTNGTKVQGNVAISKYIWNFGDGNVTSTDGPLINYTYKNTGNWPVSLTVEDKADPAAKSDTVSYQMYVGLVLDYFNWTPFVYGVFVLVGAGLVYYIFMETRKYVRSRRVTKAQKMLMKKSRPS
jgi:hypothetical protein